MNIRYTCSCVFYGSVSFSSKYILAQEDFHFGFALKFLRPHPHRKIYLSVTSTFEIHVAASYSVSFSEIHQRNPSGLRRLSHFPSKGGKVTTSKSNWLMSKGHQPIKMNFRQAKKIVRINKVK